jgi:ubiquinone/menaquinone biosynthesis C-methylase UbiE
MKGDTRQKNRQGAAQEDYRAKTRKYYADHAASYPEAVALWRLALLEKYNSRGKNILELGCGTGNYLLSLPNSRITGIDLSGESIAVLKKRKGYAGKKKRITAVVGDITGLPFKPGEFDICFSFSTLYYVKEIDSAIAETARVLKKGGIAILEFANSHSINILWDRLMFSVPQFAWSRKKIFRMMEDNGFEIVEVRYRNLIPNFFNKFDNDFIRSRFLQRFCFRVIVVARKK